MTDTPYAAAHIWETVALKRHHEAVFRGYEARPDGDVLDDLRSATTAP